MSVSESTDEASSAYYERDSRPEREREKMDWEALHQSTGVNTDSDDGLDAITPIVRVAPINDDEYDDDDSTRSYYDPDEADEDDDDLPELEEDPAQIVVTPEPPEKECWVCLQSETDTPNAGMRFSKKKKHLTQGIWCS